MSARNPFLLCLFLLANLRADQAPSLPTQTVQHFEKRITTSVQLDYLLHLPPGYSQKGSKRWPLIVFLHGSGEKGTNINLVKMHGPPKIVETQPDFPFILVSPQCPFGYCWWSDEAVLALIDDICHRYKVDQKRIYLTGLSLGGYAAWSLATTHPEKFAAVAPMCGGGDPADVTWMAQQKPGAFKKLGVWAFHGAKDDVVRLTESQEMVDAFKKAGCTDFQLTVYPNAGHNCWTEAYANPRLYEWFLQHRRE
jgi:predicted peptidase